MIALMDISFKHGKSGSITVKAGKPIPDGFLKSHDLEEMKKKGMIGDNPTVKKSFTVEKPESKKESK